MTDGVDDPWKSDDVDVTEMTNADFERRTARLSIYESDTPLGNLVSALAEHYGVGESVIIDRAVRTYIAHLIDEHDLGFREEYNITILIPPAGWEVDHPQLEYGDGDVFNRIRASTPPTVVEMIDALLERGVTEANNRNRFIIEAIHWFNSGNTTQTP